jgi:hypothetical protein
MLQPSAFSSSPIKSFYVFEKLERWTDGDSVKVQSKTTIVRNGAVKRMALVAEGRQPPVMASSESDKPFRYFHFSPEVIRLVVMMYVRFPLILRNVEYLLFERGIDLCHETVRLWSNRFGPLFAADIRRQRVNHMRGLRQWKWHLDEMYVKLGGEMIYLWRAVDHEREILESFVTKKRDQRRPLGSELRTLVHVLQGRPKWSASAALPRTSTSIAERHDRVQRLVLIPP